MTITQARDDLQDAIDTLDELGCGEAEIREYVDAAMLVRGAR